MRVRFVLTSLATILSLWAPAAAQRRGATAPPAQVNITGAWTANFMGGIDIKLFQEGSRVWGKGGEGNGEGFFRGSWVDGRLLLVFTFKPGQNGQCPPRVAITLKGTAMRLDAQVRDLSSSGAYAGSMTRTSADPGSPMEYPFADELKNCGQLFTYELAFDSGSDVLKGADWPLLAAVGTLLKGDPALKIQIAGHTDSTGNAAANQALSVRRADAVKQILVEKYGADAARVTTKGWGSEQPLADNDSDEGRALNRRVEMIVAR